jgi:Flp pilus assembly protein TadB
MRRFEEWLGDQLADRSEPAAMLLGFFFPAVLLTTAMWAIGVPLLFAWVGSIALTTLFWTCVWQSTLRRTHNSDRSDRGSGLKNAPCPDMIQ